MIRNRITQFLLFLVNQLHCTQGGVVLGRVAGAGPGQEITIGAGLTLTGTTLSATGGSSAWGDITGKPVTFSPVIGSGAGDAVAGNDARLSDSRTPSAHNHPSSDISDATAVATANTVAKRDSNGSCNFEQVRVFTVRAGQDALFGSASQGNGVSGVASADGGNGAFGYNSAAGIGVGAGSLNGTGLSATSTAGTYHALFGLTVPDKCAIERLWGAFSWFRGAYKGTIRATDTLTASRAWILPDKAGNVSVLTSFADATAAASGGIVVGDAWWNSTSNKAVVRLS